MSLTATLSDLFDTKTRARGREYYRQGSIISTLDEGDGLSAQVLGSGPRPYRVFIKYGDPHLEDAECDCPYYNKGYLCKHIWAVLLHIEQSGMYKLLGGGDDGDACEEDGYDGDAYEADVYRGDDYSDDFDIDARNRRIIDLVRARFPQAQHLVDRLRRAPAGGNEWRQQIRRVAEAHERIAGRPEDDLWRQSAGKQNEVWYALNVGASLANGELVVDLSMRETKKNGEFGKFKQLSTNRRAIDSLTRPEDQRALGWLLGNGRVESYSNGYGYGYDDYEPNTSRVIVAPMLYAAVLPMLASTGRFVWILEREADIEEGRQIQWDDGEPWRFRLAIGEDAKKKCWRISGKLCRDGAERPLDEAVLLQSGVVLWKDTLARLDSFDDFPWIAALRSANSIAVPYAERDELLAQLWSRPLPECGLPASLRLEQVQQAPRGRLQVQKEQAPGYYRAQSDLYAKLSFNYGEQNVALDESRRGIVDAQNGRVMLRDRDAERALIEQLTNLKVRRPVQYMRHLGDVCFAKTRLGEVVAGLVKAGWVIEAEGKLIRPAGSVSIRVTSGVDWFDVDGEVQFDDGATATMPAILAAVKRGERYIRLGDGSQGMLPEDWLQKHGGLIEMAQVEDGLLRFRPTQAMLLDALLAAQENVTVDRRWRQTQKRLRDFNGVSPRAAPRTFSGELREYQQQGLGWLHFLRDFNFGGCLADDMGLGKTVQVLALLDARRIRRAPKGESRSPSLVVVPKSLVFNWIDEAARFTPKLRVLDYTGLGRKKKRQQFDQHDAIVTTYGTLRKDIAELKDTRFDYAILDESQAIKNDKSQAAKACRLVQADHRLAMTGTPVENHLGELWSLFEFLNPGMLGSSPVASSLMKSAGKGDADSLEVLRRGLAPYMLRRTKEQVLTELPEKTEQTLYCEMDAKQRKAYHELRDYYRVLLTDRIAQVGIQKSKIHVLEALLRLRQAACHPGLLDKKKTKQSSAKLDALLEQLDEIVEEGHKALVFSQFTSLLSIVRQHLDKKGVTYEYLDGRTRKRQDKVNRFQDDPACPLFLISLKAGGHGLNLTAADYVYILDPWWNPAVEAQAVDRAHRIGQQRPVFAYRLICRDTVEEKIIELQQQKRNLADAIVSADSSVIRSLTSEDLQLLLS